MALFVAAQLLVLSEVRCGGGAMGDNSGHRLLLQPFETPTYLLLEARCHSMPRK